MSIELSKRAQKTLVQLGNIYIPETSHLPRFSDTKVILEINRMAKYMHIDDLKGLNLLLGLLSYMPKFVLEFVVKIADSHEKFPSVIGVLLKTIHLGFSAIVRTLYFTNLEECSDKALEVFKTLGWESEIPYFDPDEEMKNLIKENDFNSYL